MMTLTEAIATPIETRRRSSRVVARRQADLGDLIVEIQSRLDELTVAAIELRRLVRDNARAITHGEAVAL